MTESEYEKERDKAALISASYSENDFVRGADWCKSRFEKEIERIKFVFIESTTKLEKTVAENGEKIKLLDKENDELLMHLATINAEDAAKIASAHAMIETLKNALSRYSNGPKDAYNYDCNCDSGVFAIKVLAELNEWRNKND